MKRHGYIIGGQVQGVGFRAFVYRAATRLRLTGHVGNTSDGVRDDWVTVLGSKLYSPHFTYQIADAGSGISKKATNFERID